ncbi:unnamed protein product [Clonostachys solani]|uniref:Major facilitator superfamily (MFS) profile domain-containing protein n=1 Tax=Clonostachys solani TaxID=160281 RepID=A0A9N9YV37_9HYPO|nr:unnamed protein product [Clonostachys solani]
MTPKPRCEPRENELTSAESPLLDAERPAGYTSLPLPEEPQAVSWASIPKKGQLAIIVLARLAEPLSERSLTSYLFYQLRWLSPGLEPSEIAKQAGYLTAVFAAAQCLTSMWWGRAADHPHLGRKRVLIIGLSGSALSALGMGFSTSIYFVFLFRFLAGALNGNVGVLRTMISEIIDDKRQVEFCFSIRQPNSNISHRYQSRAFLLLPMCFNVGVIIGPLLSGFLADPIHSLPNVFGPGSAIGGTDGVWWMAKFPYALPNLLFSTILSMAALGIVLGLDETHPQRRHLPDFGRKLGRLLTGRLLKHQEPGYVLISDDDYSGTTVCNDDHEATGADRPKLVDKPRPPFKAIFTKQVTLALMLLFLQSIHVSAFNSILFSLLPTPKAAKDGFELPFRFTGGLGLSTQKIGFANTTIGLIGLPLQLILYPIITSRIGVKRSYRMFLPASIGAYVLLPYLVLLPEDTRIIWTCLSVVLVLQVVSRTFVNPATVILVNNSAPSPNLLGSVHGFATSVSSAARIVGPTVGGSMLGWGLSHNFVALPLWILTILAAMNWMLLVYIQEVQM